MAPKTKKSAIQIIGALNAENQSQLQAAKDFERQIREVLRMEEDDDNIFDAIGALRLDAKRCRWLEATILKHFPVIHRDLRQRWYAEREEAERQRTELEKAQVGLTDRERAQRYSKRFPRRNCR